MPSSPAPVLLKDRVDILDILRGFALIGVMIDNLFGFTGWGYATMESRQALSTWPADGVLGALENVLIAGKFYSLFSLLFGVGFSIILVRNQQKGINALPIFYRRLFILMLFGAFHLFFVWEGDILFLYALIGLFLPLFKKLSDRNLLILALVLILSPILIDLFSVLTGIVPGKGLEDYGMRIDKRTGVPLEKENYSKYLFNEGSGWREWRNWQASGWTYRFSSLLHTSRIPKVLAMFLLGFYVGRKMMYIHLQDHIWLMRKLRFWGLLVGIPSGIGSFYFEFFQPAVPNPIGLAHSVFYALSVVPLSLAYTCTICLHWLKKNPGTVLKYLAPVGRMALTNYFMQTFIGIFLYYGVGLRWGGDIGPSLFIPIGLVVYLIQILYSNLWFRYFQYGPLEWIWRQLTYGKRLPMRNNVAIK